MFKTNWKTTLFGLGAAGLNLLANGTNWREVLFAVGIAALGIFAKDANVSGGGSTVLPNAVPDPPPVSPLPAPVKP
jgi:hypothetical protein